MRVSRSQLRNLFVEKITVTQENIYFVAMSQVMVLKCCIAKQSIFLLTLSLYFCSGAFLSISTNTENAFVTPSRPPSIFSCDRGSGRKCHLKHQIVSRALLAATSSSRLYATAEKENSGSIAYTDNDENDADVVDVAIIGAGLGGLCSGAILNTLYGKKVGIYESHYLPGGCAHAFDRKAKIDAGSSGDRGETTTFTFDAGPTILLGCSSQPFNPLQQILNVVGQGVEWISYDSWGVIENPTRSNEQRWKLQLGPEIFQQGPLATFGGPAALKEFEELRELTKPLVGGGSAIPAMAMRAGSSALIPLLRYLPSLATLLSQGDLTTGTFEPFMDGPLYVVKDKWLRNWLDALAFSLSGLPASRTSAAAMSFVLYDMHRNGATLDYPKGGFGEVINALVRGVEQGDNHSKVHLRRHVKSIDCSEDGSRIAGITLENGKRIIAKDGVICNAPVWSLRKLLKDERVIKKFSNDIPLLATQEQKKRYSWATTSGGSYIKQGRHNTEEHAQTLHSDHEQAKQISNSLLFKTDTAEMTGSFLHLHLAVNATGLDRSKMQPHYTVMDRSLGGDESAVTNDIRDGPCGEQNMIALSNPCVIDETLSPLPEIMILHAYGAGNGPYQIWENMDRKSPEYEEFKEQRAEVLWRAVESVIPDARERTVYSMLGSPLTHERFLRRDKGTYGAATEDYLKDGSTPYDNLVLAGDSIFPGIGMPAVALSGASAANSLVNVFDHWKCLDGLKRDGKL